jgi:hypothetical protein
LTHGIAYVATDQNGVTSISARIVIIEAADAPSSWDAAGSQLYISASHNTSRRYNHITVTAPPSE